MTFDVSIAWHPGGEPELERAAWVVRSISGDQFNLCLVLLEGPTVRIPFHLVEYLHVFRKE